MTMSKVTKGRWIPDKFYVPEYGGQGGTWEGGYCWNCTVCGKEFVGRDKAYGHWKREHLPPREMLEDGLPRYALLKTIKNRGTGELPRDITFATCSHCGKGLRYFWAVVRDRATATDMVLGSECVLEKTGATYTILKREAYSYAVDEEAAFEELRIRSKVKEFEAVSGDILAHLEKRISEEKKLYDNRRAAMETAEGAIAVNCRPPVYRGELWESFLSQIRERGSLSPKQIALVREDMTRDRTVKLVVGEKVTIGGKVTRARYEADMYGSYARLTVRTDNGVDYIIKVKANGRHQIGTGFAKRWKILVDEDDGTVAQYPETLSATGTIKWVDPLGGKAVLTRCK